MAPLLPSVQKKIDAQGSETNIKYICNYIDSISNNTSSVVILHRPTHVPEYTQYRVDLRSDTALDLSTYPSVRRGGLTVSWAIISMMLTEFLWAFTTTPIFLFGFLPFCQGPCAPGTPHLIGNPDILSVKCLTADCSKFYMPNGVLISRFSMLWNGSR